MSTILNQQHLQDINKAIEQLKAAQKEIDMAKRAGLHTTAQGAQLLEQEKQAAAALEQLQRIKNTYFPNG